MAGTAPDQNFTLTLDLSKPGLGAFSGRAGVTD